MDIISITIGVVFLALFTVPFLIVRISNNKNEKELVAYFKQVALSKNILISEYDTWNQQYIIGMDHEQQAICYLHKTNLTEKLESVIAKELKLVKTVRSNKTSTNNEEVIDKVGLSLELLNGKTLNFEFYDSEVSNGLADELILVEKWKNKLL